MKDYETPELVQLGDVLELTLGYRPAEEFDGSEFYDPGPPGCLPGCGPKEV
jgi:hypothetical protein